MKIGDSFRCCKFQGSFGSLCHWLFTGKAPRWDKSEDRHLQLCSELYLRKTGKIYLMIYYMKKLLLCACTVCMLLSFCTLQSCSKNDDEPSYNLATLTFETMKSSMVASDEYGTNLYGKKYYWMDDSTGLCSKCNGDQYYSGGIAVSNFNKMDLSSIPNNDWCNYQMDVYYKNKAGYPGYNNSKNCAVSYGYKSSFGEGPTMYFSDTDTTQRVIDHLYICNTTYGYYSAAVDDVFGVGKNPMTAANKGWFKVTFKGIDKNGNTTGSVDAYLVDYYTSTKGPLTEWQLVNLSSLGRIHTLYIDMSSSDTGTYGINNGTYFAIDNISVRIDKGTTPKAKAPIF